MTKVERYERNAALKGVKMRWRRGAILVWGSCSVVCFGRRLVGGVLVVFVVLEVGRGVRCGCDFVH